MRHKFKRGGKNIINWDEESVNHTFNNLFWSIQICNDFIHKCQTNYSFNGCLSVHTIFYQRCIYICTLFYYVRKLLMHQFDKVRPPLSTSLQRWPSLQKIINTQWFIHHPAIFISHFSPQQTWNWYGNVKWIFNSEHEAFGGNPSVKFYATRFANFAKHEHDFNKREWHADIDTENVVPHLR